jgi:hypothetical protein
MWYVESGFGGWKRKH